MVKKSLPVKLLKLDMPFGNDLKYCINPVLPRTPYLGSFENSSSNFFTLSFLDPPYFIFNAPDVFTRLIRSLTDISFKSLL